MVGASAAICALIGNPAPTGVNCVTKRHICNAIGDRASVLHLPADLRPVTASQSEGIGAMRLAVAILALLTAPLSSGAADFEAGVEAYRSGDFATALTQFRALAPLGIPAIYANLGRMYALGEGVEPDPAAAAGWFRQAAEAGDAAAQVTLGLLHYHGEGVARDLPRAYGWLNVAAAAGSRDALDYMTSIMREMDDEQMRRAQSLSEALFATAGGSSAAVRFSPTPAPPPR
jgi:TPR repeat protein